MSPALAYLRPLIAFDSISRRSNEPVSERVAGWLTDLGFDVEHTSYLDHNGVAKRNLVARRDPVTTVGDPAEANAVREHSVGNQLLHRGPSGLAYFCHTDTVTADRWTGPGGNPFEAVEVDDRIYGRGSCDMKGSLAAMLAATGRVNVADQRRPLWIVCTADEEVGFEGARHIAQHSREFARIRATDPVSIIGEPTRLSVIHAHKGMIGLRIHSHGRAAHSSSLSGVNANVAMVPMLQTLAEIDERCRHDPTLRNNDFDPPTLTWNFGFSDGMKTVNIVPDHCTAWVSFRSMPGVDGQELIDQIQSRADELGLTVHRYPGGGPLHTDPESECVRDLCRLAEPFVGKSVSGTVCYATDGCALPELTQRIVCGPGDIMQAHTVDEFIETEQLENGVRLYQSAIEHWCC